MTVEMWDSINAKYHGVFDEQYQHVTEFYEDPDQEVETYLERRVH